MDGWTYDENGTGGTPQFRRGVQFIARKLRAHNDFGYGGFGDVTFGGPNFYMMYATTKALRLALGPDGTPKPIVKITDAAANPSFDWFRNDPTKGDPMPYGLARSLVATQNNDGHWYGGANCDQYLSTAWGVIMLAPNLFEVGPKAACTVTPTEIGSSGTTAVTFDASATVEQNANAQITSYDWAFGDGSTSSGATVSHTYGIATSFPHTYNATVTVTDSKGGTDTASCSVQQVNSNVAPTAVIGGNVSAGEYAMCPGGTLVLDGSGSSDPRSGTTLTYKWDWTPPVTFTAADATTSSPDATAVFSTLGPGVYNIGLQVTNTGGKTGTAFGHVTVKTAADASCNRPPVATDDAAVTTSQTPVTIAVLANDSDPDGQTLAVTATTAPLSGSATTNGTTISYVSSKGFAGTDTFSYTISDGHGGGDRERHGHGRQTHRNRRPPQCDQGVRTGRPDAHRDVDRVRRGGWHYGRRRPRQRRDRRHLHDDRERDRRSLELRGHLRER